MITPCVLSASLSLIRQKAPSCAAIRGSSAVSYRLLSDRVRFKPNTHGGILPAHTISACLPQRAGHTDSIHSPNSA
jgi:hypothetical protein